MDDRRRSRSLSAAGASAPRSPAARAPERNRKGRPGPALEPRKQPRQQRSSKLVDRILDAALTLTREKGAAGPSTLEIAQRAGLSVGSVYQYFPNKQAILLDLARRWLSAFPEAIAARVDAVPPADGRAARLEIRMFLEEIGQLYSDNANLLPVLDAMLLNPDLRPIVAEYDARITGLYGTWLARLDPDIDDATAARLGLLMMEVGHTCLTLGVRGGGGAFAPILDNLEAMWLALLGPLLEFDSPRCRTGRTS